MRDASWNYKDLLKYFKKLEKLTRVAEKAPIDSEVHGYSGLIHNQNRIPGGYFLTNTFVEGSVELGYPINDYNGPNPVGASIEQLYINNGRRQDMGSVFVKPYRNRANLKVLIESYVTKIEINPYSRVAHSVIYTRSGVRYRARASKEIILSAGSIGSPRTLMLSGIGPRRHLEKVGIDVIQDLEVGSGLKDYAVAGALIFSTNVTRPVDYYKDWVQDYLKGEGDLTGVSRAQAIGFYPLKSCNKLIPTVRLMSDITLPSSGVQKYMDFTTENTKASWGTNKNAVVFELGLLNPKSSGTLRLKNSNPFEYPLINPRFLSDAHNKDIDMLYEGIKLVFRLKDTLAYKKIQLTYNGAPLPACTKHTFLSKSYWYCFLRQVTLAGGFPTGTCPIGVHREKGAVVDSKLRVIGISRLRVADESVFPRPLYGTASIQATVVGEKLADDLKRQY